MDPFALPDPFESASSRRRPAYQAPEGSPSALGSLADGALSGLGYVGSELDKLFGGRAVRGFLAGKPREILSALPGSDVVGLTDEADTASGRDVLEHWGALAPNEDGFDGGDVAGFAADVLLDPSTYLGGIGALTKAGKVARMEGRLTRGFLPAVAKGERTLMYGFHGPAVAGAADAVASGLGRAANVGLDLAEKVPVLGGAVKVGREVADAVPPVARSLFDASAGRVPQRTMQAANEFTREPARRAAVETAKGQAFDLYQKLQPVLDAGADRGKVTSYLTQVGEGLTPTPIGPVPYLPDLDAIGGELRQLYAGMPKAEEALGLASPKLTSEFNTDYMMRQAVKARGQAGGGSFLEKALRTSHPSQMARKEIFDVPGGTEQLKGYIADPALSGANRTLPAADVRATLLQDRLAGYGLGTPGPAGIPVAPDLYRSSRKLAGGLEKYLGSVDDAYVNVPGRAEPPLDFFNPDVIGNFLTRATRGADVTSAAQAAYDVMKRVGVQGGPVPVTKVLRGAGLKGQGAYENALNALGLDPQQVLTNAYNANPLAPLNHSGELRKALKGYGLPEAEAAAATKYMKGFVAPEEVSPVVRAADSLLNLFRAGTYGIFPSAHARNALSGVYENAAEGTVDPAAYAVAAKARAGLPVDTGIPSLAALTPAEQTRALQRLSFVKGVTGQPQGQFNERIGARVADVGSGNPALPRKGLAESARPWFDFLGAAKDPTGVAGVGGRVVDTNPMVRAGRDVGTYVEDNLRGGQFVDRLRNGFTPDAARDLVEKTHFNYGDLSHFERNVMKRLVPYYTFTRKNLPKQVERAVTRPMTLEAPLRLAETARGDGYVPQYLQSGLAIPVGENEDGTQRYLSQLGLPFEEAFGRLKVGSGLQDTAGQTFMSALSTLRPELKVPLELATGKQFMTGRDLADLRTGKVESVGGILDDENGRLLSEVLSGTPATRMISTANRVLDERKGVATKALGLLTGAKLTDVDSEKWRAIDARHALEKLLQRQQGVRESVDYYATPDAKAAGTITPEQQAMLDQYAGMKARARAAAQAQRIGVRPGG